MKLQFTDKNSVRLHQNLKVSRKCSGTKPMFSYNRICELAKSLNLDMFSGLHPQSFWLTFRNPHLCSVISQSSPSPPWFFPSLPIVASPTSSWCALQWSPSHPCCSTALPRTAWQAMAGAGGGSMLAKIGELKRQKKWWMFIGFHPQKWWCSVEEISGLNQKIGG